MVERRRLPNRREGDTVKVRLAGQSVYIRVAEFDDGSLGEIFVDVEKEGSFNRSLINEWCIMFSYALQIGGDLTYLVDKCLHSRFEPSGVVQEHPFIKSASSVLDLVARHLAIEYLDREDLKQA